MRQLKTDVKSNYFYRYKISIGKRNVLSYIGKDINKLSEIK